MRLLPKITEILSSGQPQVGKNRPQTRVTVEPDWELHTTGPVIGTNVKGPFRWWQAAANDQEEVEIPNIISVEWDRSTTQDVAGCTITIQNQWPIEADLPPENPTGGSTRGFGRPGWLWPTHGRNTEAVSRWGQLENEWDNILVQNALLRTYQGLGGFGDDGLPLPLSECLSEGYLAMTGVWIVDKVVGGTNGLIVLTCRDIGRVLLDQSVYPPVVPSGMYPLEYYPAGTSPYITEFGPQNTTSERLLGVRNINLTYANSSSDERAGTPGANALVNGHKPNDSLDGSDASFALSDGWDTPSGVVWWEFDAPGSAINRVTISPWRGPYECFLSIRENGVWQTSGNLVPGSNIPYVMNFGVNSDLTYTAILDRLFRADKIRLTFRSLYQSSFGPEYFRAGLREVRAGFQTTDTQGEAAFPHALGFGRAAGGGYWIVDSSFNVYGFGGAARFSENASSIRTNQLYGPDEAVRLVGLPNGQGYYVLNRNGAVRAYGDAVWYGDNVSGSTHILVTKGAVDIAVTHTGLGYWIFHSNGAVYNFGDAPSFNADPTQDVCPKTTNIRNRELIGAIPENSQTITAAVGHPTGYGWIAINGNGEIAGARGAASDLGGVVDRALMTNLEYCTAIENTSDGGGYWILSGSGHIYRFGNAPELPQAYIYVTDQMVPNIEIFFQALTWDMVRNPTGDGYYVLRADGSVQAINTPDLGGVGQVVEQPYEGNYSDISDVVKDLLLWGGWLLYDESDLVPHVYGTIESTGILSPNPLSSDTFDKRPLFDCINTLKEITSYLAYVDEEGSFHYESPNIWRPGNFVNGQRVNILHELSEDKLLTEYSVTLDADPLRSMITIASSIPDPHDPSVTQHYTYVPQTSNQLRGINKPAMWINPYFKNAEEQRTMAELIGVQIWFAQRTGSVTIMADPRIQINDQVRIFDRNTSETYIHYVRGIRCSHDLNSGSFTMTLNTNWLGDGLDWAITAGDLDSGTLEQYRVTSTYAIDRLNGGNGSGSSIPPTTTEPTTPVPEPTPTGDTIFLDNFTGTSLNTTDYWGVHNNDHYGNAGGTIHATKSANVIVGDGTLKLRAKRESHLGSDFTTGVIGTRDHSPPVLFPAYGRFEARMKVPHGQGLWPSFWMRHANGAAIAECDIMEYFHSQNPGKNAVTVYLDNQGARNKSVSSPNSKTGNRLTFFETPTLTPAWHEFAVEIVPSGSEASPTAVTFSFFLDGSSTPYHTYTEREHFDWINATGDRNHVWDIIFDLYIGGDWIGHPDGNLAYLDQINQCSAGGSAGGGGLSCTLPTNIMRAGYSTTDSQRTSQNANFGSGIDFEIDWVKVTAL